MKDDFLVGIGRWLIAVTGLRIAILGDRSTYFNRNLVAAAEALGFAAVERHYRIDDELLHELIIKPPDILMIDVDGVFDKDVARSGSYIAWLMRRYTNAYTAVTSTSSKFSCEAHMEFDYLIDREFLTPVDFAAEIRKIMGRCLCTRVRLWRKLFFQLGTFLAKDAEMSRQDWRRAFQG
jgi:hypothetical protein